MKSRKSSLHNRIDISKEKNFVSSTRSQSVIPNANKSLPNVFLKKNLAALQNYNNLFGLKTSFHIGDAETHFRKSLRKYSEFNYQKNTAWIKPKEPDVSTSLKKHIHFQIEQQRASGDNCSSSELNREYCSATFSQSSNKSSTQSSEYQSQSGSRSQSPGETQTSPYTFRSRAESKSPTNQRQQSTSPGPSQNDNQFISRSRINLRNRSQSRSYGKFRKRAKTPYPKRVKSRSLPRSDSPSFFQSFESTARSRSSSRSKTASQSESPVLSNRNEGDGDKNKSESSLKSLSEPPSKHSIQIAVESVEQDNKLTDSFVALNDTIMAEEEGEMEANVAEAAEAAEAAAEYKPIGDAGEGEGEDDFKTLLDKSLQELKQAAEDLDAAALQNIGDGEDVGLEKVIKVEPALEGDKAVVPVDNKVLMELEEAELQARSTANIIAELKAAVAALVNKEHMTEKEAKELEELNKALMKHMEDFEAKTKLIQMLVKFADENLIPTPLPLPPAQEKQPEDMLPKVLVCGITEDNMPRIIICDTEKKKRRSKSPKSRSSSIPSDPTSPPRVDVAKRLSESYDMQEKLAQDNVDLEGKRFQLQECLLNKDKTCENLQRRVCSLQAEMRILSRENTVLNEKLAKVQGKCRPRPDMPCGAGRGVCPADVENRLHHYSQTTSALEKQVEMMENEVRRMQDELVSVQRDRMELEAQRKAAIEAAQQAQMAAQQRPPAHLCRSTCHGPCRSNNNAAEQQLRELREQYNRLQDDYKGKVTEVAGLRADNEKLKCTCKDLESQRQMTEMRAEDMERDLKRFSDEKNKLLGSKEMLVEQEQQLIVAKQRFREAQDELEETRALIGDQAAQLEDYRNKYLQAQQLVEEQRRQIDMMEMENNRVSEQVAVEIQRVKNQFQEKLAELSPLPDILKNTQLKLQEEQQLRILAERNTEAISRELQMAKDKENTILNEMDKVRSSQLLNEDERAAMSTRIEHLEFKYNEALQCCEKLKQDLTRAEEVTNQREKRLDEKLHEITQLTAQLENVREESARQVARTKDRCETVRRSMQGQIADLERQLAAARAMARSAQKDRDEIRQRMQAQINNLNENFEEAQLRIRSLQGHVNFLKTSYTNMFGGDSGGDEGCDCGNFP